LSILCDLFRTTIVKPIASSIREDIALNVKVKGAKERAGTKLSSMMQISQERKKLLEENIKGRKWQWVAENIKDQIEYIRE